MTLQRSKSLQQTTNRVIQNQQDLVRSYSLFTSLTQKVRKKKPLLHMESLLNPDQQLSQDRRATLIAPELLYSHRLSEQKTKLYQHYSEEQVLCTSASQQIELTFLTEQSTSKLIDQGYTNIHVGLILLGIHGLHRKHMGTKVYISLIDGRFRRDPQRAVLGTFEVDLDQNHELLYLAPDCSFPIQDFAEHVSLVIKTRGYESMTGGTANLLITKGLIGRISNHSSVSYNLRVKDVLTSLASQGIQVLPGYRYPPSQSEPWSLDLTGPARTTPNQPTQAASFVNARGVLITRFSEYARHSTSSLPHKVSASETSDDCPTRLFTLFTSDMFNPFASSDQSAISQEDPEDQELDSYLAQETANIVEGEELNTSSHIHLGYLETLETELPYPEHIFTSEVSSSHVPQTTVNRPPTFPPATTTPTPLTQGYFDRPLRTPTGRPIHYDQLPTLPQANFHQGSMLQLGPQIGLWEEIIRRWESNVLNHMATKTFDRNEDKVLYVENLLGEMAKLYFQNWKTSFPTEYQQLCVTADDTANITQQIRQMILGHDEYRGQTALQNQAMLDLERLTIESMSDIAPYSIQFLTLASKTGTAFLSAETTAKYFRKLPEPFNAILAKMWEDKYPNMSLGIAPRITFTYQVLQDLCKQNQMTKQVKDYMFCKKIEIPGIYGTPKRRTLRRATNYKGKHPHQNHIKKFKIHKPGMIKCKCYICGETGHFANQCKNKMTNRDRVAIYQQLQLEPEWDVISLDEGDDPNDSDICSFSDDEQDQAERQHSLLQSPLDAVFMVTLDWHHGRANCLLPAHQQNCQHHWQHNGDIPYLDRQCSFCRQFTVQHARSQCQLCHLLCCYYCLNQKYQLSPPLGTKPAPLPLTNHRLLISQQATHILDLERQLGHCNAELQIAQMRTDLAELPIPASAKGKEILEHPDSEDIFLHNLSSTSSQPLHNHLLNIMATIEIQGHTYQVKAILDTGASKCCIIPGILPDSCFEPTSPLTFHGINSTHVTTKRLQKGFITLHKEKYPLPFTFLLPISLAGPIQMIIGMNFIQSFKGGIRIEQGSIAFYKKLDVIQTAPFSALSLITEDLHLSPSYDEQNIIQDLCFYNLGRISDFDSQIQPLLHRMEQLQFIGDNPQKHWINNGVLCSLDIINPDLIISDKPIIPHPAEERDYQEHINALLRIGIIQPSTSKHRSAAFIVKSGSDVDPQGNIIRQKSRMVFNYKRLNDNTHKDPYTLPGIDYLLLKVKDKTIFSKFDLKSGFHQVAMNPSDIHWTAFICPQGHFEWLVMPFGLKNAPAIFQKKMDQCFDKYKEFITAYIDDILIFSDNITQHVHHLKLFFTVMLI